MKDNKLINAVTQFSNGSLVDIIISILLILIALSFISGILLRSRIIKMKNNNQFEQAQQVGKKYISSVVNVFTILVTLVIGLFLVKFFFK